MEDQEKSKARSRVRDAQDWITSFDRDLIRAARDKQEVRFEMVDDGNALIGCIIQVDVGFVKFEIETMGMTWFNKSLISRLQILSDDD